MHNEISKAVLAEKYLKGEEQTASDLFKRVAKGIAAAESGLMDQEFWSEKFEAMMENGAIGAGRIMSAGGTDIKATLINCFVQPVGDCITGMDEDGYPGIYVALQEASETMRRGGGVGYDFSRIRPKGAFVKGTHSEASGPCSYMDVFDQSCKTVESAGSRRGAQMGVLRIDHPDVLEFITAKRTPGRWNNFNVSLFVEDAFFAAMQEDAEWELVHKAEPSPNTKATNPGIYRRESDGKWVYAKVNAAELWDTVMHSNYDFAEPGILLGSNINKENNLWYCEKLAASNPCAEQMLPNYGCCDLGQLILPKFVRNAFTDNACIDWLALSEATKTMVRFLDNVLDVTLWPLEQQLEEAQQKRRIGIGYTGLGSAMAMLGLKYSTHLGVAFAATVSEKIRDAAYAASIDLAKERGPFPAFEKAGYEQGEFFKRLPRYLQQGIEDHGIRNSHLLSIAPTGTVSLAFADNCSNGIEPIFDLSYKRNKRKPDGGNEVFHVMDHALRVFVEEGDVSDHVEKENAQAYKLAMLEAVLEKKKTFCFKDVDFTVSSVLPDSFVTAQELTVEQHLNVLAAVQPFIDSAISKTINVPADYPFEDFKAIYTKANALGLKGVACYRPNNILGSVLVSEPAKPAAEAQAEVKDAELTRQDDDPANSKLSKRPKGDLDAVVKKVKYSGPSGDATMYITASFAAVQGVVGGDDVSVERPVEVFVTASPDGVPAEWVAAYARNLSLLARAGVEFLSKALQDGRAVRSDKGRVRYGWYEKDDGSRVPRFHSSEVALIAYAVQEILVAKGVLDVDGNPVPSKVRAAKALPVEKAAHKQSEQVRDSQGNQVMAGKECKECGAHAVIRKDGCEFCTNCGSVGSCG